MPKESIIQHYSSATTGNIPAAVDLALGELAINTADERVFIKNNAGTVLSLSQTRDLSGAFARTSATVSSVNGFTGAVQVTGSGAVVHSVSGTTTIIGARLASAAGATGVASFRNTHFTVGTTGHVQLAPAYQVTGDTVITVANSGIAISTVGNTDTLFNIGVLSLNGLTGAITVTGDGGSSLVLGNNRTSNRIATTSLTGVASFLNTHFTVDTTGHVKLASAYTVTGDTVQAGSGISIGAGKTINNTGVLTLPLAAAGATGVASFRNNHFTVDSTGHVQLAAAYQVTGDTVQAGSGISIGAGKTINNTGVLTFNGSSGTVTYAPPLATASVTGVASFRNTHFTVDTTGHVQLAAAYQVTGDTVVTVANSGIAISTVGKTDTLFNIGVLSLNSLTGAITLTGDGGSSLVLGNNRTSNRIATTSLTGVASFLNTHFTVDTTGHVKLASAYTVTGDTVQAGSGISINAQKVISNTGVLTLPLATLSVTGVASFRNTHFTIGTTGHVQLAAAYQVTGDTVQAGSGISINAQKVISNSGVLTFNGSSGTVGYAPPIATLSVTGVASFRNTHFTIGTTGHVQLAAAYQVTGDTVQAGSGISINAQKVISNTGVLTLPLSTAAGATGVASFSTADFSVATTGHVSLGTTVARTNAANTFTSLQSFNAGVSASNLSVAAGATFSGSVRIFGDLLVSGGMTTTFGENVLIQDNFVILNSNATVGENGGIEVFRGSGNTNRVIRWSESSAAWQFTNDGTNYTNIAAQGNLPLATAAGATGVASFRNTHFTVDTTGHVQLAAAYQATGDTVQAGTGITIGAGKTITNAGVVSLNGLVGAVTLTGDGAAQRVLGNNILTNRIATDSATGVAAFNVNDFTVTTPGIVSLKTDKTVFDTVDGAGVKNSYFFGEQLILTGSSGLRVTTSAKSTGFVFTNTGVLSLCGLTGNVCLTGDGGAVAGRDNSFITTRVASASATGVASFNSTHFSMGSTGHVSLATAYTVTGDTVQAGTGITIGAGKTITNAGVVSLNGLVGATTLTGDGGSSLVLGNNRTSNRIATTSLTGVASFRNTHFTVDTTGHVQLAAAYQVTGDTVQAGSGISIGAGKTINNTGVLTFNGSSGTVGYAPPLTTAAGATGVASFRNTHFTVDTTGHVQLAAAYQVTGDTVITVANSGIAISTVGKTDTLFNIGVLSLNGLTGAITVTGDGGSSLVLGNNRTSNRIATTSLTGVASFLNTHFTVDTTGHVKLATAYTVTGDTVQAGSGISIGAGKTINNTGVLTLPLATLSVTGVASFRNTHFTIGTTGHVQLAAAYQVTGQTVVSGGASQLVSTSGNTVTIDNRIATASATGVASFSSTFFTVSATGNVQLAAAYQATGGAGGLQTVPLATTSLTGVASFSTADFVLGTTGHVSLTGTVAKTSVNNLFTAAQRFNSGLSGTSLFVGSPTTLGVFTSRELDDGIGGDVRVLIKSKHSNGLNLNSEGVTASSLILNNAGVHVGHNGVGGFSTLTIGVNQINDTGFFALTPNYTSRIVMRSMVGADNLAAEIRMPSANNSITGTLVFRLPQDEGTFALTKNLVSAINGLTGAITVTGDGGSSLVLGNNRTSNRIATTSLTGVASFSTADFVLGTTGHVSLTGTVAKTNVANTFTALQSFSTGLSASNGITFGSNVTINGNLNATTKSFVIPHPSKSGMTLRYGSLEGPENGVYVRGRLRGGNTIELPDYWTNLVDEESITVNLTPIGSSNQHYVIVASTTQIVVGSGDGNIDCYYMVLGERKDVPKLEVEY